MTSETLTCAACLREADSMGVLDTGERIYLHERGYCLRSLDDEHGLLAPAVDQIQAHVEEVEQ